MPSGKGARKTNNYMLPALESVDYINALGTSISAGDIAETLAIKHAFGDQLHQLLTGYMLRAAGGAEAVFCLRTIRDQVTPPTVN